MFIMYVSLLQKILYVFTNRKDAFLTEYGTLELGILVFGGGGGVAKGFVL